MLLQALIIWGDPCRPPSTQKFVILPVANSSFLVQVGLPNSNATTHYVACLNSKIVTLPVAYSSFLIQMGLSISS
jgi:hypothetical protein